MHCQIELIPRGALPADPEDILWDFLTRLSRSGQVLRDYTILKQDNYILSVTLPHADALDPRHDTVYVRQSRTQLQELFEFRVQAMGENCNSQPYCTCGHRPALELVTSRMDIDSPVVCCGCGRPVALYEIPFYAHREDHYELLNWQDDYAAMDMLWMRCLCDRYTGRQLRDPHSALNRLGRELAADMEQKLGIPVYCHIFRDRTAVCPGCGETMTPLRDDLEVCTPCRLSADR